MPLIKSGSDAAFKANVGAEVQSGRDQKQALAIAYRVQRDAKAKKRGAGGRVPGYAPGGMVNVGPKAMPFQARGAARSMERPSGIIASAVPGRTDKIPMSPKGGSYILPADSVSALGQGNSAAGANALNRLFKIGPYGTNMPKIGVPRRPGKFAEGGAVGEPNPIMAAGGEFVIEPERVAEIGGGDISRGHDILDSFVKQIRAKAIKTLRKLPPPKKR